MKPLWLVPVFLLCATSTRAQAGAPDRSSAATAPATRAVHSAPDIQWGAVPPALPRGAQIAVLQGDPFKAGVYTLRLKMPDGYTIPPHFHPTDEMVTVVSGNLLLAQGDAIDEKAATSLRGGAFMTAAAGMHHYAIARGETIVQVHGMGPFAITYVHPGDDPQTASGAAP